MTTTLDCADSLEVRGTVRQANSDNAFTDRYQSGNVGGIPTFGKVFANGTGSGLALYHFHKAVTLVAGAPQTFDLTALASETFGTIAFASVKRLLVRLRGPAAGVYVTVGNAALNPWSAWSSSATATENVADLLYRRSAVDGWAVDATHKNLKLAASAGTLAVDLSILGS